MVSSRPPLVGNSSPFETGRVGSVSVALVASSPDLVAEESVPTNHDTAKRRSRSPRRRVGTGTREALIAAAFVKLENQSLDGLSIREVTAEAGITPAAFYRHFADIDELSLVLIDESFSVLGTTIRGALVDLDPTNIEDALRAAVAALRELTVDRSAMMRLIARERFSGRPVARRGVQSGLQLLTVEVASELRAKTRMRVWNWDDILLVADLFVGTAIYFAEQLLLNSSGEGREDELADACFKQMFLIAFGADHFYPLAGDGARLPAPADEVTFPYS